MALVELRRLAYEYPAAGRPALRDLDLDLEPGLTLVSGPSGSGKSTLLRLLDGLVPHFHGGTLRGRATVAGRDVATTPVRKLATVTGFVFQDPEAQLLQSRVDREVAFGPANLGLPAHEIAVRVGEALERARAGHLRERSVATLSGGERQRIAVAAALAMRPRVLALDEPASQLDAGGADAVASICRELAAQDVAVVLAEPRLAGRLRGRELSLGELVERPAAAPDLPLPGATAWSLDRVSLGFGGALLLEDVTLEGREGEALALIGPNGGGKTTLLRAIAGLQRPLAGRIRRDGGRFAYLPQNPTALLHRQTVLAEVRWTLAHTGAEESPGLVLEELGLIHLAERYPRDLSGGERQRAAVAAVLAGSPRVALLDEPTRGMDGTTRAALANALARLRAGGCSVVVATHDEALVRLLGARRVGVAGGRVSQLEGVAV
jgi:energy-coupling factor transport system ATP-binding protein